MRSSRRFLPTALLALAVLVGTACQPEGVNYARGNSLKVDTLTANAQAGVYEAAVRGAFELSDPSLSLLLDQRELPRKVGLLPGGNIPDSVETALRRRNVTQGTCEPPLGVIGVPHCTAARPGYVLRFSPVFGVHADTVQVYLYAQKYDTPNSEPSQVLRFERAYRIVGKGDQWKAVSEARMPKELRGER